MELNILLNFYCIGDKIKVAFSGEKRFCLSEALPRLKKRGTARKRGGELISKCTAVQGNEFG